MTGQGEGECVGAHLHSELVSQNSSSPRVFSREAGTSSTSSTEKDSAMLLFIVGGFGAPPRGPRKTCVTRKLGVSHSTQPVYATRHFVAHIALVYSPLLAMRFVRAPT